MSQLVNYLELQFAKKVTFDVVDDLHCGAILVAIHSDDTDVMFQTPLYHDTIDVAKQRCVSHMMQMAAETN